MSLQTKSLKRKTFAQEILMAGEPMQMRIKKGKWYANFFHNDNFIGLSLKAYAPEKKKAHINLGKILEKLANGETIGSINKKLKDIVKTPEQVPLAVIVNPAVVTATASYLIAAIPVSVSVPLFAKNTNGAELYAVENVTD